MVRTQGLGQEGSKSTPPPTLSHEEEMPSRRRGNQTHSWGLLVVLALLCGLAGCGGNPSYPETSPTTGLVTFRGQPLTSGTITYAPVNAQEQRPASGQINGQGKFSLSTFRPGDGAMPGEYRIAVVAYAGSADSLRAGGKANAGTTAIPGKYSKPQTSGLTATVSSGSNYHEFPLEP